MRETDGRLNFLVDKAMYHNEALYHAQVEQFRSWLKMTEMAMEDENIHPDKIERMLNRLVYGVPNSSDAYLRQEERERMLQLALSEEVKFRR